MHDVLQRVDNAVRGAQRPAPRLVAVSKTRTAAEVAALAAVLRLACPGQAPAFGENYVQEAAAKMAELAHSRIEWHLIGHLQSNKAAQAATLFDWVQTVDRAKLVSLLARHRPPARGPLNVLIQVNINEEAGKHGCSPAEADALAARIVAQPQLALRGLMAIPAPDPDPGRRRAAFGEMRRLYERLQQAHAGVDTLSMGMSDDLELAIAEGATMVRVGTALFGPRSRESAIGNRESDEPASDAS
ncbi:MAG: YggS family pyridoxal phosphate-dependent enzyme [Pseudomonadota bacterium]|nr:YggS family pyridoxal phosphate-dependent enzyme [Pseudomonadota bacterium]